jgi:hypothetical protein
VSTEAHRGSWQVARSLLAVTRASAGSHHETSLLLTASIALGNLLFCVIFENPIKEDPTGRILSVFLFIQAVMLFVLTFMHLAGTGAELLRKTLVMPVTASVRLAYAFLSSMRYPCLQALVFSELFFLLVIYHQTATTIILVPMLGGFMAANIIALTALGSVAAIQRSRPPTILVAYIALGIVGLLAASLLLHMPGALGILPPVSWTTRGILAAAAGESWNAILYGAANVALLIVTGILGRRIV